MQTAYVRRGAAASKDVDDGRINVVVSELKRLGIEVAGVQETHWFGQDVYSVGNSTVLARGRPLPADGEAFCRGDGVAIILRVGSLESRWLAMAICLSVACCGDSATVYDRWRSLRSCHSRYRVLCTDVSIPACCKDAVL